MDYLQFENSSSGVSDATTLISSLDLQSTMDSSDNSSVVTEENPMNEIESEGTEDDSDFELETPVTEATILHHVADDGRPYCELFLFGIAYTRIQIFNVYNVSDGDLVQQTHKYVFDIDPVYGCLTSQNEVRSVFRNLEEFLEMVYELAPM